MRYCNSCGAENPSDAISCFACQHSLSESAPVLSTAATVKAVSGPLVLTDASILLHNRYRRLEQIGTGGFGAVYKAQDTQDNNHIVALKEINIGGLQPQQVIDATNTYNREVELLALLTHPNLPRIYEHFTDPEHWYIIMDFIKGQTLEQLLTDQGGRLPLEEVLAIGIQLCDVLDYLHTRQPSIIFRNLKPANIMLTQNKQVYLIDFGSARFFKPGKPKDTIAFGSPGYAAPEQYGKAQTTAQSDLYSLGATLHQLLTDHDPSNSPFAFPPLQVTGATFPSELEPLLLSMVALAASKRPQSAQEVKQELQQIATQRPRRLYPNSMHIMGAKRDVQSFTSNISLPLPPSPPAEWATQAPSVQQAQQMLGIPVTNNSPNKNSLSRRVVVTGLVTTALTASLFGVSALYSHREHRHLNPRMDGSNPQYIPQYDSRFTSELLYTYQGHHDTITAVGWNNTSARIASASMDGTVQVWDYNTGRHVLTYKGHKGQVTSLAWSPDGKRIASIGSDNMLHIWDAQHGTSIINDNSNSTVGAFTSVAWSANGTSIAVASRQVQIFDIKTANVSTLSATQENTIYGLSWSLDGQKLAIGNNYGDTFIYTPADDTLSLLPTSPTNIENAISALTWIGDSNTRLAIAINSQIAQNYRVEIWDATPNNPRLLSSLPHTDWVFDVASTPDGYYLASAGNFKQVLVWDLNSNSYGIYDNHSIRIRTVAWSRDSKMIASGGDDNTVQVWKPSLNL